jgi:hypothetical protein
MVHGEGTAIARGVSAQDAFDFVLDPAQYTKADTKMVWVTKLADTPDGMIAREDGRFLGRFRGSVVTRYRWTRPERMVRHRRGRRRRAHPSRRRARPRSRGPRQAARSRGPPLVRRRGPSRGGRDRAPPRERRARTRPRRLSRHAAVSEHARAEDCPSQTRRPLRRSLLAVRLQSAVSSSSHRSSVFMLVGRRGRR